MTVPCLWGSGRRLASLHCHEAMEETQGLRRDPVIVGVMDQGDEASLVMSEASWLAVVAGRLGGGAGAQVSSMGQPWGGWQP